MKCVVSPLDEPAPVTLQRSNSRGGSMSRMNDLDDISLTDPLPLSRSNSNQGNAGSRAGKPQFVAIREGQGSKNYFLSWLQANQYLFFLAHFLLLSRKPPHSDPFPFSPSFPFFHPSSFISFPSPGKFLHFSYLPSSAATALLHFLESR